MCAFPIDGHIFHVYMPIKFMLPKKAQQFKRLEKGKNT